MGSAPSLNASCLFDVSRRTGRAGNLSAASVGHQQVVACQTAMRPIPVTDKAGCGGTGSSTTHAARMEQARANKTAALVVKKQRRRSRPRTSAARWREWRCSLRWGRSRNYNGQYWFAFVSQSHGVWSRWYSPLSVAEFQSGASHIILFLSQADIKARTTALDAPVTACCTGTSRLHTAGSLPRETPRTRRS